MKGPSSWSSNESKSLNFAHRGTERKVMFSLPTTNKAASVKHLSSMPSEDEVLAPSDVKYKVKSVDKRKKRGHSESTAIYYVELEEVE